ncbi:HD-GYP domain-containing protein [Uliginosibacterium aquaticum]|uniref:Phosphohydrolase n=1 Tax=Uliginosibacterium aquaticum TaxID=2731212 RepID=A0ABX2IQ50_9RHOO|nr:HD domain-containing phosphohydrolase [Uliginosibacterium aquaticum]NSL56829.1 hypothetical protein [Uliginosibacterium aquaticum]
MPKHRIHARQLLINEDLPWDVYDESGQLLLCKGFRISRESQREVLMARGLYVDELVLSPQRSTDDNKGYNPFRVWDSIIDELEVLLRDIRLEKDFCEQISGLAKLIQELARRSPDIALAAIILTNQRRYPIIHSVHVAVLSELVAARLEWLPDRRISLICAALTQNLAMIELQMKLCHQRIAPSTAQRQEIQRHPKLAHEMLQSAGVKDPIWLHAVLEHHELNGGGGYPFGIVAPCEEALLIQTTDIFSAKVSPRAARKPVTPQEAARSLYLGSDKGTTNRYVAVLIKEIGIFPPGTFVTLTNGELALVIRRGAGANTPEVLSLISPQGTSYIDPIQRNTSRKPYDIATVIPRDQVKVQINPERIWRI